MADWSFYTTHGWSLFPIYPRSKTPAVSEWEPYQTVPAAPPVVQRWASDPALNSGVATGAVSGVIVLDLDGMDAWAAALARGLPDTLSVRTPRGWHYYFQHPGWQVRNRAGPKWCGGQLGWDIRGDGGYVVGPGSYYEPTDDERAKGKVAGSYSVETMLPVAPAPDWLLALLAAKPVPDLPPVPHRVAEQTSAYGRAALYAELVELADAPDGTVNNQVNLSVFAIAQLVAGGEITEDEARGAIDEALAAKGIPNEDKAHGTVERAWAAGFDNPRAAPPAPGPLEQFGARDPITGDVPTSLPDDQPVRIGPTTLPSVIAGSQILEYFQGCTYIIHENSIYVPGAPEGIGQSQFNAVYGGPKFFLGTEGDQPTKSAWECFTANQIVPTPTAWTTCFRPELPSGRIHWSEGLSYLNTYFPIRVRRVTGDATPFLRHVRKLLPVGQDADLLLHWMASCVQNPGHKFQWWPVIQGTKGNGKTLILSCMFHAIGRRYSHLVNPEAMQRTGNQFNDWIVRRLFLGFEEIQTGEGQTHFVEMMKDTVTNRDIVTEGKGKKQVTSDNRANGIMLTNHPGAVPVDENERRFGIFWCAQQSAGDLARDGMDGSYFPELYAWLRDQDGYAIVAQFLATMPLRAELDPARDLHRAPDTSSTPAARAISKTNIELEIQEAIDEGRYGFRGGFVSSDQLRGLMERNKIGRRRWGDTMRALGYDFHPGLTEGRVSSPLSDGSRPRLYVLKDHPAARLVGKEAGDAFEAAQAETAPTTNVVPFKRP